MILDRALCLTVGGYGYDDGFGISHCDIDDGDTL